MSICKTRIQCVALLFALFIGIGASSSISALEFEVVMVPKVVMINGIPSVRMIPQLRAIPLPPGILPGLAIVDEKVWDESAVRKVLHTFAFGGHATDEQIKTGRSCRRMWRSKKCLTLMIIICACRQGHR